MKTPRPNYKSSLLLAWIIGFTALNIWFMRLSSFNALSRTEFKSRSNWVVDNNSNARIGVYDSMMDDDQMGYDDDNHRTYSADFEALPQWEDSADALPNQQAERGGELSALKELAGGKRGKIAWLMRLVALFAVTIIQTCLLCLFALLSKALQMIYFG